MRRLKRLLLAIMVIAALGAVAGAAYGETHGYRIYVLHTGSMTPTYPTGAIVIDRPAAADAVQSSYHVGEVITFQQNENADSVVTHRIYKMLPGGLIRTKGDANPTPDTWYVAPRHIEGRVLFGIPKLGYALVFFRQTTGISALALAMVSLSLLWGIFFPKKPAASGRPANRGAHVREDTDTPVAEADTGRRAGLPLSR